MDDENREIFTQKVALYDYIRFCFCDINGISRCKVVPARNAAKYAEVGPLAFNGLASMGPAGDLDLTLKKVAENHCGNMSMVPVQETLHDVPWAGNGEYRVGSVICETKWMPDLSPQEACPRYVCRKQLERLRELGYTLLSGFEHEYMMFEKGTRTPAFPTKHYCAVSTTAAQEKYLFDLEKNLNKVGINVDTIQTEYGAGQFEITCLPKFGLATADETFIFRETVKEITNAHGYDFNFMSKPMPDLGSGTHFNFSVWDLKGEKNVLHDPEGPDRLSDFCRHWVGGLLKHVDAMTALCSPTVNCYRRLHTPWAADIADWGIEDRFSSIRLKNYSHKSTLIENRLPGGASNPYLVTAVTIAAGIDGVLNKIEPPPMYQKDAPPLPTRLEDALTALEKDDVITKALGPEFIEWFIQPKRLLEVKPLEGFDPKDFNAEAMDKEWALYSKLI